MTSWAKFKATKNPNTMVRKLRFAGKATIPPRGQSAQQKTWLGQTLVGHFVLKLLPLFVRMETFTGNVVCATRV